MKFQKNLLMLSLTVLLTAMFIQPHAQAGGDFVGNGGGIAEKNFLFALDNFEKFTKMCLDAKACRLDYAQQNLIVLLNEAMPKEKSKSQVIYFVSEQKFPGTFLLNGEMKVAKTGSRIGDPIYINTDLLYTQNSYGVYEAMTIPQALSVLIHEFAHHLTATNCEHLDLLGTKVAAFLQNQIQNSPTLPWNPNVSVTIVSQTARESFPQVLLRVEDTIVDLSDDFYKSIYCPSVNIPVLLLPFPDITLGSEKPEGAIYHNVHWEKFADEKGGLHRVTGNLTKYCKNQGLFILDNSFVANISFEARLNEKTGKMVLDRRSIQISQEYRPWYKFLRSPF